MQEIIDEIASISSQTVFFKTQPECLDFTDKDSENFLFIYLQNGKLLKISLKDENFLFVISILRVSIFSKGMRIISWNWKNFASYVLNRTGKDYLVGGSIFDLKIIESYLGIKNKSPDSISNALFRLKSIVSSGLWKSVEEIYKGLHLSLITNTIPNLENSGVIDLNQKSHVYAYYEVEGQENGRLKCFSAFDKSFVPHAMGSEQKNFIKPINPGDFFMSFDFKSMEVFVLSWLSKDPLLEEACTHPDLYLFLYEKILKKAPEKKSDRFFVKKFFLPVIYGQSALSLSQRCAIPKDYAISIIDRMRSLFPVALKWVDFNQQQFKELGYAKDYFGKRRNIEKDKDYLVRNFCIQSPSSIICLEKLNDLFFAIKDETKIAFMVHDSYFIYANKENYKLVYNIAKDVLSSESCFCNGLKLKTSCQVGNNLNELKLFKLKGEYVC